ncbi:hypothetical protein BLNAU_14253 [Blattamonas nauphoetae]|uniref:Uncharacterized protein n=1 Tax=Blattamonas nauphoetae TaxID=2049346 RepID=A0ABQ9XI07_9EUKA|nr:hypothetical protein BLNAU_14253 [Blattamonas nauphoetae]
MTIPYFPFSVDCSPFLNWDEKDLETVHEKEVVFRSLVTTLRSQPQLNVCLEAKAVQFLKSLSWDGDSADAFLRSVPSSTDDSATTFVQSIVVLTSSASQTIVPAAMKLLYDLLWRCSAKTHLDLIKADMIPQIIATLNPLSLSLAETIDIHTHLLLSLRQSLWPSTPLSLAELGIRAGDERQAVHTTILKQVVAPSEKYISHLCVNRYIITNGDMPDYLLTFFAQLLKICSYYQRTMDYVLHMPVVLTISSCLTIYDKDDAVWNFLYRMIDAQQEWTNAKGEERQMGKTVLRMLRMEGIEDVIEGKLRNNQESPSGQIVVAFSIGWNILLGMNVPEHE